MSVLLDEGEVEGRLTCFGDFSPGDKICVEHCALSITCAIAKNRYFSLQNFEDSLSSFISCDMD